jgi:2,4-dienoyl-CoA reductase-like NADH-dependent reductase (Old Yellow Enzyme family)
MTTFPNLFRPIDVGPFTLKNRIAVSPHGPMYAEGGLLTQRYVDYEIEKAKGGAGLVIMSFGIADPQAPVLETGMMGALVHTWRRENIPYFREIADAVRDHGARTFFQFGENALGTRIAPSAFPHSDGSGLWSREMTAVDIARMMDNYARCAETLAEAGLDGVEMHGHGDFFSDFFSRTINRRTDNYGGSLENRMRFFLEAADVIRGVIGRDMALGARISVDDQLPGSLALADGVEIARLAAETGKLDYLNIDTVVEPQLLPRLIAPMYMEKGYEVYAAEAVKAAVRNIPVFTVGRITDPAQAEQIIAEGRADVVTMARALIADPELPNKARDGRADDIRPCLGDNQECMGRILQGLPMRCTVNPAAGRETEFGIGRIGRAARSRKLMVVGGGPAGAEAARVAASRGHEVHLYERGGALGGQVQLARTLPGRAEIGAFLPWQARQLEKLGVRVTLDTEVTPDVIRREGPEAVVLATGAVWQKSGLNSLDYREVEGWEAPHVLALTDAVRDPEALGARVVILDLKGFVEAPGLGELLAGLGRQVEIVTPFPNLGQTPLDLTLQTPYLKARLFAAGVKVSPDTMAASVEPGAVNLVNLYSQARSQVAADHVVIISGRSPVRDLEDAVRELGIEHRWIGDGLSPLNIGKAIRDGFEAGLEL